MQFYTKHYMAAVSISIAPLQTNAHTAQHTHITYIPVDILKHNRQGERERYLVSRDCRHIGRHCRLDSHYPVSHWIWRRIIPSKRESSSQKSYLHLHCKHCHTWNYSPVLHSSRGRVIGESHRTLGRGVKCLCCV